jgi:hypothetical protein
VAVIGNLINLLNPVGKCLQLLAPAMGIKVSVSVQGKPEPKVELKAEVGPEPSIKIVPPNI